MALGKQIQQNKREWEPQLKGVEKRWALGAARSRADRVGGCVRAEWTWRGPADELQCWLLIFIRCVTFRDSLNVFRMLFPNW